MIRSYVLFAAGMCALALVFGGCKKSSDNNTAATGGTGVGTGGTGVATGGTGVATGGTGVATGGTTGGAGAAAPNMPDPTCKMGANGTNPACDNCACTPDAMGGCLDELVACEGTMDPMANMLCKAIADCASTNKCSGTACTTPCMTQINAAINYMGGAPVNAVTLLGQCTAASCGSVCP